MTLDARAERSRREVAATLAQMPSASRGDIQAATGLGASTVASVVRDLIAEGRVRELPPGESRGPGRPSSRLILDDLPGHVIGVDIGHRHVAVAVASTAERILAECRVENDGTLGADALIEQVVVSVAALLETNGLDRSSVLRCVVSVPAPLEPLTGRVHDGPIIVDVWRGRLPAHELAAALRVPVTGTNDANAGALGEHVHGVGRGTDDLVYVNATTGIGAGLVLGGRLYPGHDGAAGEIGHIRLSGATGLCRCGQRGCLESEAALPALVPRLAAVGVHVPPGIGFDEVLRQHADHPAVRRLLAEAGRDLGSVLADICNLLSPAMVIVGGELAAGGEPLRDGIVESLRRYALSTISSTVQVVFSSLGSRAELVGAVALAASEARSRGRATSD